MKNLQSLNAVVTGCSGGLGYHIARELAVHGVNIVAVARSIDRLNDVANELSSLGVRAIALPADVTNPEDRQRILAQTEAELGPVDILVNNAGKHYSGRLQTRSPEMIREVFETNLIAPVMLSRAVLPGMLARRRGHLVHISSLAGKAGLPYLTSYASSKYGLVGFNQSLQGELRGTNVQSTAICTGFMAVEGMWARYNRRVHPGFGLNRIDTAARRVVRAILHDEVEVIINRMPVAPIIMMWSLVPALASKLFDIIGVNRFMQGVGSQGEGEKPVSERLAFEMNVE